MTTIADAALEELTALCRRLRLKYIRQQLPDVILTAKAQRWDPAELLRVLLTAEAEGRDQATIEHRRKKAKFPAGKTFDAWNPTRSSIPIPTQDALRTLEWIDRGENLMVCGPSGTGKSHFCEALGHHAINTGRIVAWFSIEDLGALIRRHRIDDSITKGFAPIYKAHLIVVDDIGLLPITEDAAEGLYRLVDACYEQRSVVVSSNLHPSGFDQLIDHSLASALVDRLMHHAHLIVTEGESIRLADATQGKGVIPLPT